MQCSVHIDGFAGTTREIDINVILKEIIKDDDLLNKPLPKPVKGMFFKERYVFKAENGRKILEIGLHPYKVYDSEYCSIVVPGYACSAAEGSPQYDPYGIIQRMYEWGNGHLTKADLALDVRDNPTLFKNIKEASLKAVIKERIRSDMSLKPCPVGEDETIYYNRREQNRNSLCVYDKAKQQGVPGDWIRIEFRAGSRHTLDRIQGELLDNKPLAPLVKALLGQYFTILAPSLKPKKNRPVAAWWQDVVGPAAEYQYSAHYSPKPDKEDTKPQEISLDKLTSYVSRYLKDSNLDIDKYELHEMLVAKFGNRCL